jgi:hypothetical protein
VRRDRSWHTQIRSRSNGRCTPSKFAARHLRVIMARILQMRVTIQVASRPNYSFSQISPCWLPFLAIQSANYKCYASTYTKTLFMSSFKESTLKYLQSSEPRIDMVDLSWSNCTSLQVRERIHQWRWQARVNCQSVCDIHLCCA